mgnify:CR=1 FL=1
MMMIRHLKKIPIRRFCEVPKGENPEMQNLKSKLEYLQNWTNFHRVEIESQMNKTGFVHLFRFSKNNNKLMSYVSTPVFLLSMIHIYLMYSHHYKLAIINAGLLVYFTATMIVINKHNIKQVNDLWVSPDGKVLKYQMVNGKSPNEVELKNIKIINEKHNTIKFHKDLNTSYYMLNLGNDTKGYMILKTLTDTKNDTMIDKSEAVNNQMIIDYFLKGNSFDFREAIRQIKHNELLNLTNLENLEKPVLNIDDKIHVEQDKNVIDTK